MTNVSKRRVFGISFVIFSLICGMIILSSFSVPAEAEKDKVKVLIGLKNPDKISIQNIEDIKEKMKQMKEMKKQMKYKMDKMEVMVKSKGGKVSYNFHPFIDVIAVSVAEYDIEEISKDPNVLYIEEDAIATIQEHTSSVPEYQNSWGVDHIEADFVAAIGNRGAGIKVAILDTGIDYTHPDLNDNYVPGGPDYIENDGDPMDDESHGTHVAGIVAAELNGVGVVGVGPQISLIAVKVCDSQGICFHSQIISGIQWAADNADIASMSFGGPSTQALNDAVEAAHAKGLLMIAAAGNKGNPSGNGNNVEFPALYDEVIAVAATNQNDQRASFSSTGNQVELSAPGVSILSTIPGNNYVFSSGTSVATPHVSGAAALVMNSDETCWQSLGYTNGDGIWSNTEVRAVLDNTADDLGSPGRDTKYGFGLVDPDEAAQQCSGPLDTTLPVITPPADVTVEATTTTPPGQAVAIGTATATDIVDPNPVITNNAPALFPLGTTIVTWTATDATGNSASADQTVTVVDTTPPVITLNGDPTPTIEAVIDAPYVDPGASATDAVEGPVTVVVGGDTVDANTPGVYTITYDASDSVPNAATQFTRTVTVQDTTAPVVTPPVSITEQATGSAAGDIVSYPPATATDDVGVTSGPTCTPASGSMFPIGVTIVTCTASDAAGNTGSTTFTITIQDIDDNFGIYRHYPSWGGAVFALSNVLSEPHDIVFNYGLVGDIPVAGDWDGDGVDTVGIYRHYPSWGGAVFALSNVLSEPHDIVFNYGLVGDIPVAGDWDGDGVDTVGIYRHYPSWGGAVFALSNGFSETYDIISYYGIDGDIPVAGDWDGDGVDTVGIYRHLPGGGAMFALSNGFSEPFDIVFNYGLVGDIPVAGDWDGDGVDTVGIYRHYPSWGGAVFALSNGFSETYDIISYYGIDGDIPVAGDWD